MPSLASILWRFQKPGHQLHFKNSTSPVTRYIQTTRARFDKIPRVTRQLKFIKRFAFSQLPSGWKVTGANADWNGNPLLLIEEGKPPYPTDRSIESVAKWINALPTAHHLVYW